MKPSARIKSEDDACMETLDIWKEVHPALLTLPVEWKYKATYGIVYAKKPNEAMQEVIEIIQRSTRRAGGQQGSQSVPPTSCAAPKHR